LIGSYVKSGPASNNFPERACKNKKKKFDVNVTSMTHPFHPQFKMPL
jgi:hypothetical protein